MAATSSPKKFPRGQPKSYSTCLLYNAKEASKKLQGLAFAACNPKLEKNVANQDDAEAETKPLDEVPPTIKVSDTMLCSLCAVEFITRLEQRRHYKSDWHRYNIKQRLKEKPSISEEDFDEISGNVSSISGSDSDSDLDSYATRTSSGASFKSRKPVGIPSRLTESGNTSTDSESDSNQVEDAAQRLPKIYFRTTEGELISLWRCVLCHKKWQPTKQTDLLSLAEELPDHMMWALFMAGGGHFAGAIFNKGNLVVHKTFHRYVVRAKRGTAQGSRDSQGNAPKSAGATLRRYNEAALTQDIQDLITSWDEHIKMCDKIFLRAPSFNRKIFFGGKTPPFKKDDMRIRLIPFQTRRPTFNEIRRVYELLASIECYGEESDIQDFIPISPQQVFNAETGQLSIREDNQLSPRRRKLKNRPTSTSPLIGEGQQAGDRDRPGSGLQSSEGPRLEALEDQSEVGYLKRQMDPDMENIKLALPDHVIDVQNSTGTSTGSESELVEQMETINLLELKEYATKKPKRRKKTKKRRNSLRCQKSPDSNVFEEEKYHLKNSLYTACKIGDFDSLRNLLAVFSVQTLNQSQKEGDVSPDPSSGSQDLIGKSGDGIGMSNDEFKPLTSITQDSSDQTFHVKGDKSILTDPGHSEALGLYGNNTKTADISKESCTLEDNNEQYEDCRGPGAEKGTAESVSVIKTTESGTDRTTECVTDRTTECFADSKSEKHNVIINISETTLIVESYSNSRNNSDSNIIETDIQLEGDKTAIHENVADYDKNTIINSFAARKDKTQQSRVENIDIGKNEVINGVDNNYPSKSFDCSESAINTQTVIVDCAESAKNRQTGNVDCAESAKNRQTGNVDCAESAKNRQTGNVDCAESAKNRQTGESFTEMDGILDKEVKIHDGGIDKSNKDTQTSNICNETDGILINDGVENLDEQVNEEQRNTTNVQSNLALKMSGTGQLLANNLPDLSPVVTISILNEKFGDNDTTLLHVAAREGHKKIISLLMATGADPAIRDRAGLTPYMVSKDKPIRNEFRKFMGLWPEKYDYTKAQIPPPLSEEQENERKKKEAERKKVLRKAKQERQKEKQAEEAVRAAEEREKNRFLGLSDREKRALAADRRLLDQASKEGAIKPVLSRCWQCGADMSGKVPFEYMDYKFCSPKCLQTHRKQKPSK